MKFRAFRIDQQQSTVAARYVTMAIDELTAGEVVIRVQYSSVNYKDALAATGAGKILRRYPLNGGVDLAGVVERSEVPQYVAGQAVLVTGCGLSETLDGGYAEYARVPALAVIPMPAGIDAINSMSLGTAGFTAALAIHRMEQNGQTPAQGPIVVTGASGGVGSIAIDMLTTRGYKTIAITGKPDQREYLRKLGAEQVWLRDELKLGDAALEPAKFAGAIDNVGGVWLSWLIRSLSSRGNITSIGLTAGSELATSIMPFLLRGVNLLGINSTATPREVRDQVWQRIATDLRPRHLELIRQRVIDFEALPQVFPEYLQGQVHGRTVVRIQS